MIIIQRRSTAFAMVLFASLQTVITLAIPLHGICQESSGQSSSTSAQAAGVAPGPLADQRAALLAKIKAAAKSGVGTASYMAAFNAIEDLVKSGASADSMQQRIGSLKTALDGQQRERTSLKTVQPISRRTVSAGSSGSRSYSASSNGPVREDGYYVNQLSPGDRLTEGAIVAKVMRILRFFPEKVVVTGSINSQGLDPKDVVSRIGGWFRPGGHGRVAQGTYALSGSNISFSDGATDYSGTTNGNSMTLNTTGRQPGSPESTMTYNFVPDQ